MPIVSLYAAVLALMFVFLSVRTLRLRRRLGVPVGDGGQPRMLRAMRVHANFAEYVPLALLLLFLTEAGGADARAVHALGALLTVGRIAHAAGVSQEPEDYRWRVAGMAATFATIVACAAFLLWSFPSRPMP